MISWIQNTFQHHFRTVFAVLLGLLIVSFVFTIGPQSGFGRDRGSHKAMFFGHDLSSERVHQQILSDARLSAMLQSGNPNVDGEVLVEYGKQRITGLHLADELGLPNPNAEQLKKHIRAQRYFANEKGEFDANRYTEFSDTIAKNKAGAVTPAEITRILQEDYRRAEAIKLLAGEGYVLDQSVAAELARAGTEWTVRFARFDYASFPAPAQPTDAQLEKYFGENTGAFFVQPRAQVDIVSFPAAAFAAETKFTEEELAFYFERTKFNYAPPSTTPGTAPTPPVLATVRPQVEAAYRVELASQAAAKAASDFGAALYANKLKKDSAEIAELAKKFHGQLSTVAPFTEKPGPFGSTLPPAAVMAAFSLNDRRFFSDPIDAGADQIVVLWKQILPGYAPPLADVRPQAVAAYLENEKRKNWGEAGIGWKAAVASKLAAGATLENATTGLLGSPKVEVKALAPFTRRQPPPEANATIISALEGLTPGQVSEFLTSNDDSAFIVQVVDRKVPAIDATNPEFTNVRKNHARQYSGYLGYAIQRDLMMAEQKEYAGSSVAQ